MHEGKGNLKSAPRKRRCLKKKIWDNMYTKVQTKGIKMCVEIRQ